MEPFASVYMQILLEYALWWAILYDVEVAFRVPSTHIWILISYNWDLGKTVSYLHTIQTVNTVSMVALECGSCT